MVADLNLCIDRKFSGQVYNLIAFCVMDVLLQHPGKTITVGAFDSEHTVIESVAAYDDPPFLSPALILHSRCDWTIDDLYPDLPGISRINDHDDIDNLDEESLPKILLESLWRQSRQSEILFGNECEPLPPSGLEPFPCPDGCIPPPLLIDNTNSSTTDSPPVNVSRPRRDPHHPI
jgi:hypothetical protein